MFAVASEAGLVVLEFLDRRALATELEDIGRRFQAAVTPGTNRHINLTRRELDAYFRGELRRFTVPLDLRGSPFQLGAETLVVGTRDQETGSSHVPHGGE